MQTLVFFPKYATQCFFLHIFVFNVVFVCNCDCTLYTSHYYSSTNTMYPSIFDLVSECHLVFLYFPIVWFVLPWPAWTFLSGTSLWRIRVLHMCFFSSNRKTSRTFQAWNKTWRKESIWNKDPNIDHIGCLELRSKKKTETIEEIKINKTVSLKLKSYANDQQEYFSFTPTIEGHKERCLTNLQNCIQDIKTLKED